MGKKNITIGELGDKEMIIPLDKLPGFAPEFMKPHFSTKEEQKHKLDIQKMNIEKSGKKWILLKTAEECSELSTAILQYMTKGSDQDNIIKEIADVEIQLEYLRIIYDKSEIDKYKRKKNAKIEKRVLEM